MFTEEQQAAIDAQIQNALSTQKAKHDVETLGLVNNNKALLDEKREALDLAKAAELKSAEEAGNHAEVLRLKTEEAAEFNSALQAKLDAVNGRLIGNDKDLAVSGLASHMINNDPATRMLLGNMVKVALGDDGQITKSFIDFNGQQVATDEKGFLEWAGKDDTMRNYLAGSKAQGGNANGSNGGLAEKSFKDMSITERSILANENPDKYLLLSKG